MDETPYQLTPAEVAAQLGISQSTLRVLAHFARARGLELGQRRSKKGGGFIRLYSPADVELLKGRRTQRGPLRAEERADARG